MPPTRYNHLVAGAIGADLYELNIQVRWSFAFTGPGLVGDFDSGTTDFTTSWEELVCPIAQVPDRIVQLWELDPVFDALAADLPEGHPGRLILVFQQDFTEFQKGSLIRVWGWGVDF